MNNPQPSPVHRFVQSTSLGWAGLKQDWQNISGQQKKLLTGCALLALGVVTATAATIAAWQTEAPKAGSAHTVARTIENPAYHMPTQQLLAMADSVGSDVEQTQADEDATQNNVEAVGLLNYDDTSAIDDSAQREDPFAPVLGGGLNPADLDEEETVLNGIEFTGMIDDRMINKRIGIFRVSDAYSPAAYTVIKRIGEHFEISGKDVKVISIQARTATLQSEGSSRTLDLNPYVDSKELAVTQGTSRLTNAAPAPKPANPANGKTTDSQGAAPPKPELLKKLEEM